MTDPELHWSLFREDDSKDINSTDSTLKAIPKHPKNPWPAARENAILDMLDEKTRQYRHFANSIISGKLKNNDANINRKKKFGNFMGKLLLQNNRRVTKPSSTLMREKGLKQQILTEEPLAALFRMRKNRNQKVVSSSHEGEKLNQAISFNLKPSCNVISPSKISRRHENADNQSSAVIDIEMETTEINTVDTFVSYHNTETQQRIKFDENNRLSPVPDNSAETTKVLDESNSDNESFADSLQSDDDVLGPWIELGLVEPEELKKHVHDSNFKEKISEDCQDCTPNASKRQPLEPITLCSSCKANWVPLCEVFINKIRIKNGNINSTRKFKERKKRVRFDNESTIQKINSVAKSPNTKKESLVTPKRSNKTKAIIPPTKSHHSLKANRSMASKNSENSTIAEDPSKQDRESHYTTGAFMTRKTAKSLADPCNGFYPNPYGFAYLKNVEVLNINGHWYRGVLQMMDKSKVKVKYSDWEDQEEWIIIGSKRLRLLSLEDQHEAEKMVETLSDSYVDIEHVEENDNRLWTDNALPQIITANKTNLDSLLTPIVTAKQDDDYISCTLDKDPSQIFNNNEVFMTRSMARGLIDEYGFKPNSFGYRRNRAVAITFYSKSVGKRKSKQECVGYLREMNNNQVRVWYPNLHQSEWIPLGSRRLRLLSEVEEKASANIQLDLDTQEATIDVVPKVKSIVKNSNIPNTSVSKQTSNNCVKVFPASDKLASKRGKSKQMSSSLVDLKKKITDRIPFDSEQIGSPTAHVGYIGAPKSYSNFGKDAIKPMPTTSAEERQKDGCKSVADKEFLTTGAFATRTAMRQLKDENGFTPNPYGYVNNLGVEILNTRSGKVKFWECGRLVAMRPGQVRVHYDGWADVYDEWIMVGSRRIRIAEINSSSASDVTTNTEESSGGFVVNDANTTLPKFNDFLVAETNPELNEETKKKRRHQLVGPQDYQELGMLENLEELAMKEAQKKERRMQAKSANKRNPIRQQNFESGSQHLSSEDEENHVAEYSPITRKSKKLSQKKKSSNKADGSSSLTNFVTCKPSACDAQSTEKNDVSSKQIFSLRLAHVHASKSYQFVANVYGYYYMQHVTVVHMDKKVYEGRLISMHKNKVKVHYCGWLDKFDEYITLGSRRLQPIESDHEVECIEPKYRERYEQMLQNQSSNTQCESLHKYSEGSTPQPLINRFSRKRLTLEDEVADNAATEAGNEYHKDLPADDEEIVEIDNWKVYCNQCNIVIKQFRYYCTYCENPSLGHDYQSFELCLRCFDQNFPFWHDHPRSSFAVQAVIDTDIGPRPIKGELVTVWEEDILEVTNTLAQNQDKAVEGQNQINIPVEASFRENELVETMTVNQNTPGVEPTIEKAVSTIALDDNLSNENDHRAIDASKVFMGDVPIDTDQGYKYLKRWRRRKVCAFCNDDDDTSEELGQFIGPFVIATFNKNGVEKKRSFWAHDSCARYSPEVFCTPEGKWYNVTLALRRGRGMRCHGCKEKGATIGCFESKCNKSYHLPCSQKPVSYFKSGVIFWCGIHEAYYDKKDTYVNIFNCDGCNKQLLEESWFTCVPCASSYFSSFDLCSGCYERFPQDHIHNEEEFEETSFAILKEMEAQKAREAAREKEEIRANNLKKKKKPLFPRRKKKLADGSTPVSCCYCGTYEAEVWRKGYDGGVIMCNACFELALFIDNDGKPAEESMPLVVDNLISSTDQPQQQNRYVAPIEDYSHKPYLTRDTLSANKFSESATGSRLATYEPQPNQLFSLTFDSTYFDIPGRAPRWATHSGTDYHGTWLPQTVRRAILKYTNKDERVLSNFLGRGTDAIECFLLQRRCCGVDINPAAVSLSQRNCCFEIPPGLTSAEYRPIIAQADSRNLSGALFGDESFHHILSHPPYKDCVAYSTHLDGDLSRFTSIDDFKLEYTKVVQESWRLLKFGRRLTLGIGDNREHCFYIPVGFHLMRIYIDQGFELEELVIKRQRYCSAFGLGTYLCVQFDFLVFTHEFIATFKKVPNELADRMLLNCAGSGDRPIVQTKRTTRGVPSSAIMRKSVVMGTVWVFKPTETYSFDKLCVSRMVERFGKDDGNWEHLELQELREDDYEDPLNACYNSAEPPNQSQTQEVGESDENPLSEYEQERLKRIDENNRTLLKLGLISELSEESEDVTHYEAMMSKERYEDGDLVLRITGHLTDLHPSKIEDYRRSIVQLALESTTKLAPKGMFIVGTQDIRDPYTGKLYPMAMLVLEDIEREVGRDIIKLKEMVVTVPEGYSKDRKKDFQPVNEEDEGEEDLIDIETINHDEKVSEEPEVNELKLCGWENFKNFSTLKNYSVAKDFIISFL